MDRRRAGLAVALLLAAGPARAATQGPPVYAYTGAAPSGSCTGTRVWIDALGTGTYYCNAGTWAAVSGGGGGAPTGARYWTGAADAGLSAEHNLGVLGTGLVLNTAGTPSAYGGATCTLPQLMQSLSASGAPTCFQLRLDQLNDPTADIQWQFNGSKVEWEFTTPVDAAFTIHLIGAYTGDGVHLHQHSGSPGAGTDLFHGEWTSTNVTGLKLIGPSSAAQAATITGKVDVTGAVTATSFAGPLTGNASTATALAANPANCNPGEAPTGISATGVAESCFTPVAAPSATYWEASGVAATGGVTYQPSGRFQFNSHWWNTTDSLSESYQPYLDFIVTARTPPAGPVTAGKWRWLNEAGTEVASLDLDGAFSGYVSVPDGLAATGTPSATTYLRGDGTWSTPAGGGGSVDLRGIPTVFGGF